MIDNPQNLADQILNLAEDIGKAMSALGKRVVNIEGFRINGHLVREGNITITPEDIGAVSAKTTINGKQLGGDFILTPDDIGAVSNDTVIPKVSDVFDETSSDAMSGIAVADAFNILLANTKLCEYEPTEVLNGSIVGKRLARDEDGNLTFE